MQGVLAARLSTRNAAGLAGLGGPLDVVAV
jgi:hypothetical protein